MDIATIDYMKLINLSFCVAVVVLGIIRFKRSGVKAFLFIGLAYALFGLSWFTQIMHWDTGSVKPILTAIRMGGYTMLILGMLL